MFVVISLINEAGNSNNFLFVYNGDRKNGAGVSKREGEIEREKLIKGVGDRA